jgi:hypothetical protein
MPNFDKLGNELGAAAAETVQAEGPKVVAWFTRPVPIWVVGVASMVAALLGKIA